MSQWNKLMLSIGALGLLLQTTGCSTVKTAPERGSEEIAGKAVLPVPSERNVKGNSGVLLAYEFQGAKEGTVPEAGCRLRVVNRETKKSAFIALRPDTSAAFTALEPGVYETGRMGCSVTRIWELDNLYANGFRIEPGQTSYIGKLNFIFDAKEELTEVKRSTRSESARRLQQAFEQSPTSASGSIISGFTGRPITPGMLQKVMADPLDGFSVRGAGIKNASRALEPLLVSLRNCDAATAKSDPLRFGLIEITAEYKNGRFSQFKEEADQSTFSEDFKACVRDSLSAFRPVEKVPVEIRVVY